MQAQKVDVLVIGAGIIGMTAALELQKAGRQVTVIDRAEPGMGCSYGNAGWITPCFAMPLPQPGMFIKSIGWLLDPESPLYIKPRPSLQLVSWLTRFLFAMNDKRLRESVAVLADISKYSLEWFDQLNQRSQSFGFDRKGLLMVSAKESGVESAKVEMDLMAERGIPGRMMTGDDILALEPALRPGLKGGVYFPTEAHAEPLDTVKAVVKEFEAAGGTILSRREVYDFEFQGGRVSKVFTTKGVFDAELIVFALGTWSRTLASRLRVSIPILGGKGYHLITDSFEKKPSHPIMILERKIAVTPRANSVRLAGTLELVGHDDSITPRRLNAILTGSQEYLHMKPNPSVSEVWRGLRPCTPDGVPMIGFSKKYSNLFYSLGHQMLGLQSAPGSAKLAGDLIMGRTPDTDPRPFRAERYE
ncbi:MAG TPA: FAD-dependent oxidoreductase [Bdellovibrionales bacterium]|nr:FAD-dependent oxidoreductase [Bdellovibrionales bacterium]